MGTFLRHISCDNCGSSDGRGVYEDGTSWCFVCETWEGSSNNLEDNVDNELLERHSGLLQGTFADIPKRGLRENTCRKYGYAVGTDSGGQPCHIANYYDARGSVVAQKIRRPGKHFAWVGKRGSQLPLFGQHLWKPGKSVVITEGEIDALSLAQAFDCRWPVVSLPDGAQSAPKAIKQAYEWLSGFQKIVLCFDQDDPGQKATQLVAEMLPIGKVFIMSLPRKDPNEVLINDGPAALTEAFWQAQEWRPDGIVSGEELWPDILEHKTVEKISYPWGCVDQRTLGLRRGELVTVTAGTGIGKSAFVREIAFHLLNQGESVGMMMLEENTRRTALGLMGLVVNKPLHQDREGVTEEQLRAAFSATLGTNRLYLYDHFGSTDIDNLLNKVRYMAKGLNCGWIIIDHLSIVVSALEGNDERRMIDRAMTLLRTLVEETGIGLLVVSHLKRPEGRGHEEGGQVSLSQMRGSHAIAQLSDIVIGLERNQQDEEKSDQTTVRILKNRFSGDTGPTGVLFYNKTTGRLNESHF